MRGRDPRMQKKKSHFKRMDCRVKPGNGRQPDNSKPEESRQAGGDEDRKDEAEHLNSRGHGVEAALDVLQIAADGFDVRLQLPQVVFEAVDACCRIDLYAPVLASVEINGRRSA
jgi:hypothetical protein